MPKKVVKKVDRRSITSKVNAKKAAAASLEKRGKIASGEIPIPDDGQPRAKDGRILTEEFMGNIRKAIDASAERRRKVSDGEIEFPDDGIPRTRDGRRITEKYLEAMRENAKKGAAKCRLPPGTKREYGVVQFPESLLARIDTVAGGKMKRPGFITKIVSEALDNMGK